MRPKTACTRRRVSWPGAWALSETLHLSDLTHDRRAARAAVRRHDPTLQDRGAGDPRAVRAAGTAGAGDSRAPRLPQARCRHARGDAGTGGDPGGNAEV